MITLTLFDIPFLASVVGGVPPVPAPDGPITWDNFVSYSIDLELEGLNKGTNEWNSTTVSASYIVHEPYVGVKMVDNANDYSASIGVNALNGGTGSNVSWGWGGGWIAKRNYIGIWCFGEFSTETPTTPVNGLSSQLDPRYQSFSPWKAATSGSAA